MPARVIERCNEPRSFVIETENGSRLRRNRSHLRPDHAEPRRSDVHEQPMTNTVPDETPTNTVENNIQRVATPDDDNQGPHVTRSGRVSRPPERFQALASRPFEIILQILFLVSLFVCCLKQRGCNDLLIIDYHLNIHINSTNVSCVYKPWN